jgi:hypothetical protein
MESLIVLFAVVVKLLLVSLLVLCALVGLIALASPRSFAAMAAFGNRWIDTWKLFKVSENSFLRRLDKWINLDGFAVRYSRAVGVAMLLVASLVGYLCATI